MKSNEGNDGEQEEIIASRIENTYGFVAIEAKRVLDRSFHPRHGSFLWTLRCTDDIYKANFTVQRPRRKCTEPSRKFRPSP